MDSNDRKSSALPVEVKRKPTLIEVLEKERLHFAGHKPASHIRFTDEEWEILVRDRVATGRTIPELLKTRYFSYPPFSMLMSLAAQRYMANELIRIGNNFNQVAKVLNSGFREGWNNVLVQIGGDLKALRDYVSGIYGHH